MTERASLEEVLSFANKVRAAGGGNPLDALMPAIPEDAETCLIAKNLNFNCAVMPGNDYGSKQWVMQIDDESVRDAIAETLGLRAVNRPAMSFEAGTGVRERHAVELPPYIAQVAMDFDEISGIIQGIIEEIEVRFADKFNLYLGDPDDANETLRTPARRRHFDELVAAELADVPHHQRRLVKELLPFVSESSAEARRIATLITPDGKIVR